jgi:hypothetical protein
MALEAISVEPQRLILMGSGMSGRGIKFRMLESGEKRTVDLESARNAGKDANNVMVYEIATRDGMSRMLMAVTDQAGLENFDRQDLVWHTLTLTELNNPESDYYLWGKKLFTTRDLEFIEAIYGRLHNVPKDEFDAIMGKAQRVSTG